MDTRNYLVNPDALARIKMLIENRDWNKLNKYLIIDRKISDKPASAIPNKSRFKKIVAWFSKHDFNYDNVVEFFSDMIAKQSSPSYMNNMLTMIKHLDKCFKVNELTDFSYFRIKPKKHVVLTPDEILSIQNVDMKYSKGSNYLIPRQKALIGLLAYTGCRIGEALNLKWDDIYESPYCVVFKETKNGDDRQVSIKPDLYEEILALPRHTEYVFASYRGGRLAYQEINLDLKRRAELVGIKKNVSAHVFRHSYITTMIEIGMDCLVVGHIVGHRDPKSTMKYLHSNLSFYAEIMELHPLSRRFITMDQISKRTKSFVEKIADSRAYRVAFTQDNNEISFSIKKINE